jgi:uncharacterized protein
MKQERIRERKTIIEQETIRYLENALILQNKILVISDLHIGYEENQNSERLYPQTTTVLKELELLFEKIKNLGLEIEKIIVLGDLKHSFGKNETYEGTEVLEVLKYLKTKSKNLMLIRGNHDNFLVGIAKRMGLRLLEQFCFEDFCFVHGDKKINYEKETKIIVLGHLHPSISLSDKYKTEKYKCFLEGMLDNRKIIVLPSFSQKGIGFDLRGLNTEEREFCIIPKNKLMNFKVIIYNSKENKPYVFPRLKKVIESNGD